MEPNTSAEFSDDFNNFDDFLAESSFIAAENVSDLVLPSNSQASIGISSSRAFSSLGQYHQVERFLLLANILNGNNSTSLRPTPLGLKHRNPGRTSSHRLKQSATQHELGTLMSLKQPYIAS
jgi:hypothetical protein